ncbi:helix-turn-helix domain-containing protein [Bacillus mycoides]|uniref:helix-turn-helix domain-containing protein n=1 Tax=Bacillus mycoides TaxID=1405 RepID=UPI001C012F91|nr:helix-turn-helix transcriptional regulator [Bacillus mycoides]QWI13039.1 helix-turn-helix domain-containing protein [Bacillus mycoides]
MARNLKSAEDKAVAERISSNIKELMILRGYRQVDLVDRTGIKKSTMSDYINGNTIVPTQAIKTIANALGATEAQIFGNEIHITEFDNVYNLIGELQRELKKANERIAKLEAHILRGADTL